MVIFRAKNTFLREEHGQMARAKRPACQSLALAGRHFLPGHVWHITHRCHKKGFLLKFASDRCRWLQWLFEAKKRYGIRKESKWCVLGMEFWWVEEILKTKNYVRESKWSQSIAVGSKSFVEGIKEKLGIRARGRKVGGSGKIAS